MDGLMKNIDSTEYAIEVPGRGYCGYTSDTVTTADDCGHMAKIVSAEERLKTLRATYINMGCPEIAATLRIVARTVTVTRSDWEPVPVTEIETSEHGPDRGKHRWICRDCQQHGPTVVDGVVAKLQLKQHLNEHHNTCKGFQYVGQSMEHCDGCGQPYWEHAYYQQPKPGTGLFDEGDHWDYVPITEESKAKVKARYQS